MAPDPARAPDRLSARWLLALAARLVRDVGDLIRGAGRAQKKLATFGTDGRVRFASAFGGQSGGTAGQMNNTYRPAEDGGKIA